MNNFTNISEIIFKLGGTGSVSKLLKTNPSTISNWKKNNKIPKSYINKLDILLKERNLVTYTEHKDNKNITPIKKNSKFIPKYYFLWINNFSYFMFNYLFMGLYRN